MGVRNIVAFVMLAAAVAFFALKPAAKEAPSTSSVDETTKATPPATAARTLRLADERLTIELVTAEPDVLSPVAINWDAEGRMFVAEMTDYPVGPPGGRIRMLVDADHDGTYERSTVFAEGLAFPNGVLPYRDGVLVTAAPDILFLRDRDGDGVADERRTVLTGFAEGNQQLRVNGLHYGLDNWIYGANGRSDGALRRPDDPPDRAVSIARHDFRFSPEDERVEAVTGFCQFGLARDDAGRRFLSWNTIPLRHAVLETEAIAGAGYLSPVDLVAAVVPADDTGLIFPIATWPKTFNREPANYINASCGLTIYRGDNLPAEYKGNAFLGESLASLVQRRVLSADGATFLATRGTGEHDREFLASSDSWFHPVFLATGPDGCLYLCDFYRRFVEHPQWVPQHLKETEDWRTGSQHGRIWRIRSRDRRPVAKDYPVQLATADSAALVELLGHANSWQRDTAQRLLVERQDKSVLPALAQFCQRTAGTARSHALWTMHALGSIPRESLAIALADADPGVRINALRVWRSLAANERDESLLDSLPTERDAAVRLELIQSLGAAGTPGALQRLFAAVDGPPLDRFTVLALARAVHAHGPAAFGDFLQAHEDWLQAPTDDRLLALEELAARAAYADAVASIEPYWKAPSPDAALGLLAGVLRGLAARGGLASLPPSAKELADLAIEAAGDEKRDIERRRRAIAAMPHVAPDRAGERLLELAASNQPAAVYDAAARALAELADDTAWQRVVEKWNTLPLGPRRGLIAGLVQSPSRTALLVSALEEHSIALLELDASQRDALLRSQDAALRDRAAKVFAELQGADRGAIIERYKPALDMPGDRAKGAELFAQNCLACHAVQGAGNKVGPDLSGIGVRPPEALLTDLFDPSRQTPPEYIGYTLLTVDGRVLTGLVASETAASVTLRAADGIEHVVARDQIDELHATGKSLMPDGLEQKLDPQGLADLVAFLKAPDRTLLPKTAIRTGPAGR